jgi:hypothetical protein
MPSLRTYRTATTLCVPDLVFNDISKHKIVLPEGTPVQREILTGNTLLCFSCEILSCCVVFNNSVSDSSALTESDLKIY